MENLKTVFRSLRVRTIPGTLAEGLRLPYLEATGPIEGPVVWLTACVHGDEVGSTVIVHEVFRRLRKMGLKMGRVMAMPLMNPPGFEARKREIPYTSEDLNRCFPGDPSGTLGLRLAHNIFSRITASNPTLVLDLHNDWIRSIPYGLLEPEANKSTMEACKSFLQSSGLLMIQEDELVGGSLAAELVRQGIPALTLELGESHIVNETWVTHGVKSILKILFHLGMIEEQTSYEPAIELRPEALNKPMIYSNRPFADAHGIIRYQVSPGQVVRDRQLLATISDPMGQTVGRLRATGSGVVLGHADSAVVFFGMPVLAFGMFA